MRKKIPDYKWEKVYKNKPRMNINIGISIGELWNNYV